MREVAKKTWFSAFMIACTCICHHSSLQLTAHLLLDLLGGVQPVLKDRRRNSHRAHWKQTLMSHYVLIAIGIPVESFPIWLHKETLPCRVAESRFNPSVCFSVAVSQNRCQSLPAWSHHISAASAVVKRLAYRGSALTTEALRQWCITPHCFGR